MDGLYYLMEFDSSYGSQIYHAEFADEKNGVLSYQSNFGKITVGNGTCKVEMISDGEVYLTATGKRVS